MPVLILLTNVLDPYPFAIDECFDVYQAISMSAGRCIGMSGKKLNIILTGDSAYVGSYIVVCRSFTVI